MKRIYQLAAVTALSLPVLLPSGVYAQGANGTSDEINAIIRGLDVDETSKAVFNIKDARSVTIKIGVKTRQIMADYGHSVDLTVFFNYDSDKLTAQGKAELDKLGAALNSKELKPQRFLIAGHTDAKGSHEYNRELSYRRAMAVRTYLVKNWDIDSSRLEVHGWGESQLKDTSHPMAPVNRRVQVTFILPPMAIRAIGTTTVYVDGKPVLKTNDNKVSVDVRVATPAAAKAQKDCDPVTLEDPRPAQMPIDDFGGKRTPMPCTTKAPAADASPDRIKLND